MSKIATNCTACRGVSDASSPVEQLPIQLLVWALMTDVITGPQHCPGDQKHWKACERKGYKKAPAACF